MVNKCMNWIFFFFQAEDGIRDLTVTGVQTCALPISSENDTILPGGAARRRGNTLWHTATFCGERSEEHTSELQSQSNLVCRLLLEKKKKIGPAGRAIAVYEAAQARHSTGTVRAPVTA